MSQNPELASRWSRFIASLIDCIPFGIAYLINPNPQDYIFPQFASVIICLVQLYFIAQDGQSLGKKIMKIRIVNLHDKKNGGFYPNVLLRAIVNGGICILVPPYAIVDAIFIFRKPRRCVHDLIAGTIVINAQ